MGRIRSFSAVLLALVCALICVPSPASAKRIERTPQVREIDARIDEARARIDTWNHRLNRWQVRVGKVAVSVERLTALTEARVPRGRPTCCAGAPLDARSCPTGCIEPTGPCVRS
jgi:hypothetical protein